MKGEEMKKLKRTLLKWLSYLLCFILIYNLFELTSISYTYRSIFSMCLAYIIPNVVIFIVRIIIKKQNNYVSKFSSKLQKLEELNKKYDFREISKIEHLIKERAYSRKSLDRLDGKTLIRYYIENDNENLRTDIENSIYNISLLDNYNEDVKLIENIESENKTKYSTKKYKRIEKRAFNSLKYKESDFQIEVEIDAFYQSNGGKVYEDRHGNYEYSEVLEIYNEYKKRKNYEVTSKQERKVMSDDIRYDILKRDNFTCKKCGATAKDGAKLHVDHIIPVSKGGKTTPSNLQTLCDRCNLGKSNKTDEDIMCPACGGLLVKKKGKYGYFIGCSNYPDCRYSRQQNKKIK